MSNVPPTLNVAVIIENTSVRQNITFSLRRKYENCLIYETGTASYALEILKEQSLDLIICVSHIGETSFSNYIKKIRKGEFGTNQFSIIMVLIYDSSEMEVYKLLSCGSDDILMMPISVQLIYDRLDYFEKLRKPFVVTYDYLGPDRRKAERIGENTANLITVPNPINNKINKVDQSDIQKQVDHFNNSINSARILSYGNQLQWLSIEIAKLHNKEFDLNSIIQYSTKVVEVIGEMNKLSHKWDKSDVVKFIDELLHSINIMLEKNGKEPVYKIEDLMKLHLQS